ACFEVSNYYYHGWGTQRNLDMYRDWRLKAATLGSTAAQCTMGAAYLTGDGVPKNPEYSLTYYRKAAAKNHPAALYGLALHYQSENTNAFSMKLALDFTLRAASAGHREAQLQWAMNCFRGDVVPPDFEGGKRWLMAAAENGWAAAEFFLFHLYWKGAPPA